ncbi:hypothetical protein IJF93_01045 [Candidatus Saccharibacteria bacterium]|nr:hypothetical protein [Candidatus Saccharibacteria bacterium]
MAKEVAISKRLKISEAQQYIILSVLGASIFLGAAIALVLHSVQEISYNTKVIMAQEESIAAYSKVIETIGVCEQPKGDIYTTDELKNCDPDSIEVSSIPGTLRANILEGLASNEALNSVSKQTDSECINPSTGKNYTYKELNEKYQKAEGTTELNSATQLIKSCSALRVIPDALPDHKNEEALLASLNKLFLESGWEPESLSPSGTFSVANIGTNLNVVSVNLAVESNTATTMRVLNNIERSIREFDIQGATIEWGGDDALIVNAQATAYYMKPVSISSEESSTLITHDGSAQSSTDSANEEEEL